MKRIMGCLIAVLMIFSLLTGCKGSDQKTSQEIERFIELQEKMVNQKDIEGYMDTISKDLPEYVAEKKSWMRDIEKNEIKDYRLEIQEIKIIDPSKAFVNVEQSYRFKDKIYKVQYPLMISKEGNEWKDQDLKFDSIETEHFQINYLEGSRKYGEKIAQVCENAYKNVAKRYGIVIDEPTIIKVYDDKELLRQSVKLSFAWQFAGWYEYPESVKTTAYEQTEIYREILEHELIHKLTIKKSNNNMPYWFTEGLAVYFADFENQPRKYRTKESYISTYGESVMSISQIEKVNLEILEENEQIMNYYDTAGMIVQFMIETYGIEKVKEIVEALGKYRYQEGTGAEVDQESIERFHEVIPQILGVKVESVDWKWIAYLEEE